MKCRMMRHFIWVLTVCQTDLQIIKMISYIIKGSHFTLQWHQWYTYWGLLLHEACGLSFMPIQICSVLLCSLYATAKHKRSDFSMTKLKHRHQRPFVAKFYVLVVDDSFRVESLWPMVYITDLNASYILCHFCLFISKKISDWTEYIPHSFRFV